MREGTPRIGDVVSVRVHGDDGVLDLLVPSEASGLDVANEYARQAGSAAVPTLHTALGHAVPPEASLAETGIASGALLVALSPGTIPSAGRRRGRSATAGPPLPRMVPGALSTIWLSVAVAVAAASGWFASTLDDGSALRTATLLTLGVAAVLGVVPVGPLTAQRVLAAPVFAGAVAYALAYDPAPQRFPTILGVAALTAAVTAAVARSLGEEAEEGLRVEMVSGAAVFVVSTAGAVIGVPPSMVWALLLMAALFVARFVPSLAVDVPDQYLLDLERLAVTAWSARERPSGRRGRIVVPRAAVAAVAMSGRQLITAAAAAVAALTAASSFLLLRDTPYHLDHIGARCEVGLVGAALLFVARTYRHVGARGLLRTAGLVALVALVLDSFGSLGQTALVALVLVALVAAALLVVVGVALGRGWRSAWWSRRAEVADAVVGAAALASLVVSTGLFRLLWELTG